LKAARNSFAPETDAVPQQTSNLLARVAQGAIMISFPLLLVLIAVRLVMTPLFLQVEYNRPGFPADPYGFNRQDRLQYAPYALDYLLNGAGIEYLGDLRFADGTPLYNENELHHMYDVKQVTQVAFAAAVIGGLIALAAAGYLWRRGRDELRRALFFGALFTLAIVAAIIILAVFNWEFFFVTFHQLFFQSGTWYFPTSDTLIRLFPEQFWFDAAIAIGSMTVLVALLVFGITWRLGRSAALLTPPVRGDNL
jgi:integral membrane protein (TIGR01906 family)